MRVPLKLMLDLGRYMRRKRRAGEKYFPLVLMLEPLHACNLACIGCGRIVEYKDTIRDQMPLEEALGAADEAGAPIVSICGGEPLMYKHIVPLTKGLLEQQAPRHDLHQRDPARTLCQAGRAQPLPELQRAYRRHARDPRPRGRSQRRLRHLRAR